MQEVQHLVTAPTTRLEPNPIGQYTSSHSDGHNGEDTQLSGRCEGPGGQQQQRARDRESNLVRKQRSEQE